MNGYERLTEKDVYKRGRRLLDRHGLEDWRIMIDTRPRDGKWSRWGQCRPKKKEIAVSKFWLEKISKRRDGWNELDRLLYHEMAHALVPKGVHTRAWREKFTELLVRRWKEEKGGYENFEIWVRETLMLDPYCHKRADELVTPYVTGLTHPCNVCGTPTPYSKAISGWCEDCA